MSPALQRLRAEIADDLRTFERRLDELAVASPLDGSAGALAQAAVALHHAYGAVESALLRVARAFEGDVTGADWHQSLLTSMALDIDGVRAAVLSSTSLAALRRLLSFRHFFRHAYGVSLDPVRVEDVRSVALTARVAVLEDFRRLDEVLRTLAQS